MRYSRSFDSHLCESIHTHDTNTQHKHLFHIWALFTNCQWLTGREQPADPTPRSWRWRVQDLAERLHDCHHVTSEGFQWLTRTRNWRQLLTKVTVFQVMQWRRQKRILLHRRFRTICFYFGGFRCWGRSFYLQQRMKRWLVHRSRSSNEPADLMMGPSFFTTWKPKSWSSLPWLHGHDQDKGGHMTKVDPRLTDFVHRLNHFTVYSQSTQGLIIYQQVISDRDYFSPSTCFQTWLITCKTRRNFKHGSRTDGKHAPLGYMQRGCPDLTHQSCFLEQTPHLLT